METLTANQLIIYENDAVLVSYTNGAGLQLAPCGSVFTYHHPLKEGEHPLHGQKKVLQRTKYVTSTFKESVIEAVDFRNRFALYPYLCKDIIDPRNISKLHADICELAWPEKLEKANVQVLEDNSVMLTSLCNCAKLTLVSSRQLLTVQFLCRVSQVQEKGKWTPMKKDNSNTASEGTSCEDRIDKMWKYCVKSKTSNLSLSQESHQVSDKIHQDTASVFKEGEWDYTCVVQHFSIQECPKIWQHPLNLAQEVMQKQRYVKFETANEAQNEQITVDDHLQENTLLPQLQLQNLDLNEENESAFRYLSQQNTCDSELNKKTILLRQTDVKRLTNCVFSPVPKSLSLNCVSSHLHKWGKKDFWDADEKQAESALVNGRINVICAKGIIYRFLWYQPKAIEIYPGDGTVLRSSGLAGQFFTHFIFNNGKVEEKMYSVNMPPPDIPGSKYSIAKILKTGERYLQHLYEDSLSGGGDIGNQCCWKVQPAARKIHEPLPNVLLEQCVVNGVGKFSAYSSGRVRVVFADRTALDMYADFSRRLGQCKQHSDQETQHMPDIHSYQSQSGNMRTLGSDLPQGVCRLMLPNGHYQNVIMTFPDAKFEKYIQAAQEWASWVNCSPNDRHTFYKDTLHDAKKTREIERELRKISCFNYIVEKTLLSKFETKSSQRDRYLPSGIQQTSEELRGLQQPSIQPYQGIHRDSFVGSSTYSGMASSAGSTETNRLVNVLQDLSSTFSSKELLCNTAYIPHDPRHSINTEAEYQITTENNTLQQSSQNTTVDSFGDVDIGKEAAFNLAMVEQILQKTSRAVSDLDKYLKTNGEEQPVKDHCS